MVPELSTLPDIFCFDIYGFIGKGAVISSHHFNLRNIQEGQNCPADYMMSRMQNKGFCQWKSDLVGSD